MTTRDEAIDHAAKALAAGILSLYDGSPEEAAKRAYTPGGPSVAELTGRIEQLRAAA